MWQKEIEEILAQANLEPVISWEKFFEMIKPMILIVMLVSAGAGMICSPEARQKLRMGLADLGLPPEKVEKTIDWLIKSGTRPLKQERKNGRTGDSIYPG